MKINLRKAAAIQADIQKVIASLNKANEVSIDKFNKADEVILKATSELRSAYLQKEGLYIALYNIRMHCQGANRLSGIDALLNSIQLKRKLVEIKAPFLSFTYLPTTEYIQAKQANLGKEISISQYGLASTEFAVSIVPEDLAIKEREEVAIIGKEIRLLNDQLLDLNVKNEIELDESIVKTLKSHNII